MSKKSSASNSSLQAAKSAKNDEFYTQLSDIENELKLYKEHLKGKVILCNCDDPEWSNFWKFFTLKFESLHLKKVIATHYAPGGGAYKLEYLGPGQAVVKTPLEGTGDFRSDECIAALKEADIVVTNPPFSLFREYVAQLIAHDKQFLVIGSCNAITYKEIFPLIKDNKLWLGVVPPKNFVQPDGTIKKFGNITWFTNLTHQKRNEGVRPVKTYAGNEDDYPTYTNYDAIEVSQVKNIPADYLGCMGVPITILDKFNPDQFEILGSSRTLSRPMAEIAPKGSYPQGGPSFYVGSGEKFLRLYVRIVIKRKAKTS